VLPCAAAASGPVLLIGDEPGAWARVFEPIGLTVTQGTHLPPSALRAQVEGGAFAILEGSSDHAEQFGIRATEKRVVVRSLTDTHNPQMKIYWEKALEVPAFEILSDASVFARERWTRAPLAAAIRLGKGGVLWVAARPGDRGYERYPYLLQAALELGLPNVLRSNRLWVFLDGAYRLRVDLDYFAERWQRAGISALHVAAWHYFEPAAERDAWVQSLIEACHRRGILVYAWLELPHVSEKFWQDHPEWREKTAVGQDAHLDWRKLMNLANADCRKAVESGTRALLGRFDWDGVNLAELYFESLEGASNPARFTPMNEDIRREYKELTGTDPLDLFRAGATPQAIAPFLQYRAGLALRLQQQWLGSLEDMRGSKPHLDIALTHVDDRLDAGMRESIGADSASVLPLLGRHDFTFLIEDPATIWHLGPDRYSQMAAKYKPLTGRQEKLAIDINIVERYQDVYPTKQQTGVEMLQLVNTAAKAFPRVALYFEHSLLKPDLPLLPAAAAGASRLEVSDAKIVVDSPHGAGAAWTGPARVDGREWPIYDGQTVWLPAGAHVIEPGTASSAMQVLRLNADLTAASVTGGAVELAYRSSARVFVETDRRPARVEVDGQAYTPEYFGETMFALPRGQHVITLQ
jgi:hypothetical protein